MTPWPELPGHLATTLEAAARYRQQLKEQDEAAGQACALLKRLITDGDSDPREIRAAADLFAPEAEPVGIAGDQCDLTLEAASD